MLFPIKICLTRERKCVCGFVLEQAQKCNFQFFQILSLHNMSLLLHFTRDLQSPRFVTPLRVLFVTAMNLTVLLHVRYNGSFEFCRNRSECSHLTIPIYQSPKFIH